MADPIGDAFGPVYGRPSWGVRRGHGSFVTMDFGTPLLRFTPVIQKRLLLSGLPERAPGRDPSLHGEWHLWIYCCAWELSWSGRQIACSDTDETAMGRALDFLNGQALVSAVVSPHDGSTAFAFDLGCALNTWPDPATYELGAEQWMLYQPSGLVMTVRDDGRYSCAPGNAPSGEDTWTRVTRASTRRRR